MRPAHERRGKRERNEKGTGQGKKGKSNLEKGGGTKKGGKGKKTKGTNSDSGWLTDHRFPLSIEPDEGEGGLGGPDEMESGEDLDMIDLIGAECKAVGSHQTA